MIVLDTDALIEILEKRTTIGEVIYSEIIATAESICITSINLHEILCGLKRFGKSTREVLRLPVIGYTKNDALPSADIEVDLLKDGVVISRIDTMIAAVTINASAKLLTLNSRHFRPITKVSSLSLFEIPSKNA